MQSFDPSIATRLEIVDYKSIKSLQIDRTNDFAMMWNNCRCGHTYYSKLLSYTLEMLSHLSRNCLNKVWYLKKKKPHFKWFDFYLQTGRYDYDFRSRISFDIL